MADYPSRGLTATGPAPLAVWNVPAATVEFGKTILDGAGTVTTYFMRALRSPGPGFVVWVSVGLVDTAGARAGVPIVPGSATIQAHV